ncbi:MAG: cob(I)yrinic acid a,c-diamide adenosyltransferase [Candidatus Nitrosopelagicus sp.]|mgnify:FL=1|jgi:cob(I)alamin adenosyltransferase|nr:MAG: cob(I)yrinic acid a,c-diamide adenosyltransferase [Candidatus Nitrosopelagicus sp.]|tara:strand:+ start:945 stop:1481 length:537 start_codon:yes stop_codon:yes gene_type:complete
MKIYTKTGDEGKTSLFDNSRVWKSDQRIMSYGAVDELNSSLGIALSLELDPEIKDILIKLQNDLFIVGSDLANPNMSDEKIRTTPEMITFLEQKIDLLEPQLEPLTSFILPGGTLLASILHLSRTISRRAETHVIALSQNEEINKDAAIYLNRLSDLMFILARAINHRKNISDIVWKP